ncbi:MAG: hypothetical protein J6X55_15380, partial [Victivallales bacterium]|nr:hypothetical protein [Victivallales bacterium]
MKMKWMVLVLLAIFTAKVFAADRLAVAEPVVKGGVPATDVEAFWGMLEATVDGGYELISRSALKQMMTEIGLTCSSDLVNLNTTQKAKMGELKTVKYLLVPTIGKFGSRINVSLMMVDASTGDIISDRKASDTFESLDAVADQLKDMLTQIGLGPRPRKVGKCAILYPIIRVPNAPEYLSTDFNVHLENYLLENGIRLQNLKSVSTILQKNKIDQLDSVAPAMYARIGDLLRVDNLIQVTINTFSVTQQQVYIAVTRQNVLQSFGNIAG